MLNEDHAIGTKDDCSICQIFNHIRYSDELITKKLQIINDDRILIQEFEQLTRVLGKKPNESEFKQSEEAKERFGSWDNFLFKVKNQKV